MTTPRGKWFWRPHPNPSAQVQLFCFPYAGAGASAFREWYTAFPADVELVGIQLPGRENRFTEKRFDRLEGVLDALSEAIAGIVDRPFVFFGHSVGALIAFELTRLLHRQGRPGPSHLVVSGRRAPQLTSADERTYLLDDDAFLTRMKGFNGTPKELLTNAEVMQLFIPLLRDDFAISETYFCTDHTPVACPLTALGGDADADVSVDQLAAWVRLVGSRFDYEIFPGDHFYIHPNREKIIERLSAIARQAWRQPADAMA
ncbi:alpha/beta fold hydrolase [Rhodanobacter sp. MP1X3]|uniref:thioesterase II family protein n=1 Tax=Rhodanobacter sp. MP1X3 TaxID=2723086 RepID=UPI00161656B9|nr:alpha/beta fold hydrolase [Rhodanobacter sp. MP1X3]MBB6244690.1 medium-chain acyl-[acyl-carrier-protein] hydrolase [Rhodanobacter sp. MP1X3]